MSLRLAGPGDLPTLAGLEEGSFPADPWSEADLRTYWRSGALAGFLLEADGEPRAYALFQLLPGETELLRVGVPPSQRRRGLAARLLVGALEQLAADGRPRCHLEVRAGNVAARRLYERLGFAAVGRRRAYYADGEDAVRYARPGSSAAG